MRVNTIILLANCREFVPALLRLKHFITRACRGLVADAGVDEFSDFGEVDDFIELGIDFFLAESQDRSLGKTADHRLQTVDPGN